MRNYFTVEQDNLIKDYVKSCPQNLRAAFEQAANELGLATSSVEKRYYNKLRKEVLSDSEQRLIVTASKSGVITQFNEKNIKRDFSLNDEDRFEVVTLLIKKLPRQRKKQLIEILLSI